MRKLTVAFLAGLACQVIVLASAGSAAHADSYPSRPIRIIVPFAAGGPLDIAARSIADKLTASLKQNVIVETHPGAAGNIGSNLVAKAAPDGYTLLMGLSTTFTVSPSLYKSMPFDPQRDLRPLSILTSNSQTLAVHPSLPVNSVKEFVAYAKKNPINYANAGYGSPGHLVMEYFQLKAGFKANPVPYKGNSLLMNDLVAGHIKVGFVATAGVYPHAKAGRLKALAISSKTRSKLSPQVPTIAESGYPDFSMETYFVLAAPAGLPDPIAARLEREVRAAIKAPDLLERWAKIDMVAVDTTEAETVARIEADLKLWKGVIAAAHMQVP